MVFCFLFFWFHPLNFFFFFWLMYTHELSFFLKYSWWWWFFDQNIMISLQNVCCCCWKQTRRRFRWNIAFHVNNHLVCITLPPLLSCHLNCCYRMIKSFVLSFIHSHESENNKNFRRQYFSSIQCMYCTQSSILDLIFVCSPFYRIVVVQFEWCWLVIIITTSEKKNKKKQMNQEIDMMCFRLFPITFHFIK